MFWSNNNDNSLFKCELVYGSNGWSIDRTSTGLYNGGLEQYGNVLHGRGKWTMCESNAYGSNGNGKCDSDVELRSKHRRCEYVW